jgi:hypothetical protein
VYGIGGTISFTGGAHILLESPNIAIDMAKGGLIDVGASLSKDMVLSIIESSVKTPKSLSKNIAKTVIDQGLSEYKSAYYIARSYLKNNKLTQSDARKFLKYRWVIYRLSLNWTQLDHQKNRLLRKQNM